MAIRTIRRLFGWTDVLDSLFYGRSVLPNIFIRHYLITNVWYKWPSLARKKKYSR